MKITTQTSLRATVLQLPSSEAPLQRPSQGAEALCWHPVRMIAAALFIATAVISVAPPAAAGQETAGEVASAVAAPSAPASPEAIGQLRALFEARLSSVAAVEYYVQQELDRQTGSQIALVIDAQGTLVLQAGGLPEWVPVERLRDFRVFPLRQDTDGYPATYLGQDYLTGNHYLRLNNPAHAARFTPIADWGSRDPKMGEILWGLGINGRDWDFYPYRLQGQVSEVVPLPTDVAFTNAPLGKPGAAAFHQDGTFAGWILAAVYEPYRLALTDRNLRAQLQNENESTVVRVASDFLATLNRIPSDPSGDPGPWLGIVGVQPVDRDTSDFLDLRSQGALIVSEVYTDGPAAAAGLQARDIVTGIDGQPIPRLVPLGMSVRWADRAFKQRHPGETLNLAVIRGTETLNLALTLGSTPATPRKAPHAFFPRLGLSIRQFLAGDSADRRLLKAEVDGAIVSFVDLNARAHSGGLRQGDWVKAIDGQSIATYPEAAAALQTAAEDTSRREVVLLIERDNETQVIRISLE